MGQLQPFPEAALNLGDPCPEASSRLTGDSLVWGKCQAEWGALPLGTLFLVRETSPSLVESPV